MFGQNVCEKIKQRNILICENRTNSSHTNGGNQQDFTHFFTHSTAIAKFIRSCEQKNEQFSMNV